MFDEVNIHDEHDMMGLLQICRTSAQLRARIDVSPTTRTC